MTPANNILDASLPSLAAIHHRRRELLACQAAQWQTQASAPPEEPLAVEDSYLEEEDRLAQDTDAPEAYDELEDDPEEPYPAEDPLPPSTAPAPPTLAESAFYGLAGLAVRRSLVGLLRLSCLDGLFGSLPLLYHRGVVRGIRGPIRRR